MATSTETPSETDTGAKRRFRPYQIALVIGGGFAAITAASYVAEQLWASTGPKRMPRSSRSPG